MIPTAFYRGYELGNGLNDWSGQVAGLTPAAVRPTLYGDTIALTAVGANAYRLVTVDAFRFGADVSPKAFHLWWESLVVNIMRNDPELRGIGGELCLVEDRDGDLLAPLLTPLVSGAVQLDLDDDAAANVDDLLLIIDKNMADDRHFDVVKVISKVGDGHLINVESIQSTSHNPLAPGLHYSYAAGDEAVYRLEAVFQDCLFTKAPELPPAEEGSRAHFRRSIIYQFITTQDRYGA